MPEMNELKKLSPEERIKKLKEITEKDKKEIEDAHKLIKESEEEIREERKMKEQIPIPQVKAVDISELFSSEEKAMYRAKRMVGSEKKDGEEEKPLEQTVEEEDIKRIEEQQIEQRNQYMRVLEGMRQEEVYNAVLGIREQANEYGSITDGQREFMEQAEYISRKRAEDQSYSRRDVVQEQLSTIKRISEGYKR